MQPTEPLRISFLGPMPVDGGLLRTISADRPQILVTELRPPYLLSLHRLSQLACHLPTVDVVCVVPPRLAVRDVLADLGVDHLLTARGGIRGLDPGQIAALVPHRRDAPSEIAKPHRGRAAPSQELRRNGALRVLTQREWRETQVLLRTCRRLLITNDYGWPGQHEVVERIDALLARLHDLA